MGVHPHSRGENKLILDASRVVYGSSPLARGKFLKPGHSSTVSGFIPTRAGKISTEIELRNSSMVHPHSRGENSMPCLTQPTSEGSSPLARGKSGSLISSAPLLRFIPTRAGKMHPQDAGGRQKPVHPHSRGENQMSCVVYLMTHGSSPLARGKFVAPSWATKALGFIPTRAGKM